MPATSAIEYDDTPRMNEGRRHHPACQGGRMARPKNTDPCSIPECDRKVYGWGWCHMHYQRWKKTDDPLGVRKAWDKRPHHVGCVVDECDRVHHAKGFCGFHLYRVENYGDPLWEPQTWQERVASYTGSDATRGCWPWLGTIANDGYGHVSVDGVVRPAHVVVWELRVGPIPRGMQLDHLCRVRSCVNPDHLEPVTPRTNTLRSPIAPAAINARKTHCKWGDEFTEANTLWICDKNGRWHRECRACHARRERERKRQR